MYNVKGSKINKNHPRLLRYLNNIFYYRNSYFI
jgi:hypothetical protein